MSNLIHKTKSGLLYKFAERLGAQGVNFIVTVILARILLPEEFGVISLVTVFITILDVFVTYGFGNSLIANKHSDNLDFSTAFYFGGVFSIVIYGLVFIFAPYIANYFDNEVLILLIRIMSIRIPIAAINSVQQAYVSKHMMFQKFFISTSIGSICSGVLSIVLAYHGFGVWALVVQYLSSAVFDTVCLWFIVGWRPDFVFSFKRLKAIYDYGWKILLVGLIDTSYNQIRNLIVAKKYSPSDLAYYTRGFQFPSLFISVVEPTINGVIFPALSSCNDNILEMKAVTRRVTQISCYVLFPLVIGLLATAEPLVVSLLTDKWLACVPFLQIACLAFLFRPVQVINSCLIKASGRSGLLLKLDVIKKFIGLILLIASIPFGIEAIAWSLVWTNIIATIINIYPNLKIINYGYKEQFMDILDSLVISVVMGITIYALIKIKINDITILILQLIVGLILYIGLSLITKNRSFLYLRNMIYNSNINILKNKR